MGKAKIDMTGKKFARWTVINEVKNEKISSTAAHWECACDCGTIKVINGISLRRGDTKSCGCLRSKKSKDRMKKMRLQQSGTIEQRFFSRFIVNEKTSCWEWVAHRDKDGYGILFGDRKNIRAHRFSYEVHCGEITESLLVCHKCDNPGCVNPEHLFLGTSKDNNRDSLDKGRHYVGEKNGRAKLTIANVREIRTSDLNGQQLADKFGVTRAAVNGIRRGQSWIKSL